MPAAEITSVILRFRDLNLADGETIARHRDEIENHGATWWGWWAPRDEQLADAAMRRIADLAAGGLVAFLFDSGGELLFRVRCTEVRWHPRHEPIGSPDPELTPAYYAGKKCPAWFRFESIDDESPQTARSYSYVHVAELFTDSGLTFSAFAGKRIASLRELHYQRTTLWFARSFRAGDPEHEILLIGRDAVEPRDFQTNFIVTRDSRLLWLSDLHYTETGQHAFPRQTSPDGDRVPVSARSSAR